MQLNYLVCTVQVVDAVVERQHDKTKELLAEASSSIMTGEVPETVPRFTIRPVNITALMGEVAMFICEVEGTAPLGNYNYNV